MPTGYTATLHDGEQSFPEFATECARAFGALILLRDTPEAEIPEEFAPDNAHNEKTIAEYEARLAELQGLTAEDAAKRAAEHHAEQVAYWTEANAKTDAIRSRYEAMLAEAEAWEPPTADHQGLKDFMVKQLRESIEFDCSPFDVPEAITGPEWLEREITQAGRMLGSYRRYHAEEIQRAADRTAWVRALRQSLTAGADA